MPDLSFRDGSTWRTLSNLYFNDSGTWRDLKSVWFNDGGTWRQVFAGILTNVGLSTTSVNGGCSYANPQTQCNGTTGSVTAIPEGGSNHTYLWEKVSGTTVTVNSPTSATTTFSHLGSSDINAVYRCRVEDDQGTIVFYAYQYW